MCVATTDKIKEYQEMYGTHALKYRVHFDGDTLDEFEIKISAYLPLERISIKGATLAQFDGMLASLLRCN